MSVEMIVPISESLAFRHLSKIQEAVDAVAP